MKVMERYKQKFIEETSFDEMVDHFYNRTVFHIALVQKYIDKILNSDIANLVDKDTLIREGQEHDNSKFEEPLFTPYVYINWKYKLKREGEVFEVSDELKERMIAASELHIKTELHHPEYWSGQTENLINPDNRDLPPSQIIDATAMPLTYLAVMCSDWCAMGAELNNNPYEWANRNISGRNINPRWKFSQEQVDFIFKILDTIWVFDEEI